MRLRTALGSALAPLVLAGCGAFFAGGDAAEQDRLDAEITVLNMPGEGQTAYVRSTRPRLFGQLFQRVPGELDARRQAELQAAARAVAESMSRASPVIPPASLDVACEQAPEMLPPAVQSTPAGFRLHDPAPGGAEMRVFHVTGFADGCARSFSAVAAALGSATAHEAVRLNPLNQAPWSATDGAFEEARARLCGGAAASECRAANGDELDRHLAVLSIYRSFGPQADWQEVLLEAGAEVQPRPDGQTAAR